jgi:hypothetical protein
MASTAHKTLPSFAFTRTHIHARSVIVRLTDSELSAHELYAVSKVCVVMQCIYVHSNR